MPQRARRTTPARSIRARPTHPTHPIRRASPPDQPSVKTLRAPRRAPAPRVRKTNPHAPPLLNRALTAAHTAEVATLRARPHRTPQSPAAAPHAAVTPEITRTANNSPRTIRCTRQRSPEPKRRHDLAIVAPFFPDVARIKIAASVPTRRHRGTSPAALHFHSRC